MSRVLEGIKVVEVSVWAYVPSAGAALAEWGAEVVKVEPPAGDPMRGLVNAGVGPMDGIVFPWELWNRGKKGLALDLTKPEAQEIVLKLCEQADVFLTSYLPPVRRKLGIDLEAVRERNPDIIYATGTGQGALGPEAERGGYDSITFWSRGSVAAALTPPDHPKPIGMPAGAFGDSLSGLSLAGGIAAALVRKARTGEGAVVDASLLGTAMWAMQMASIGTAVAQAAIARGDGVPAMSGIAMMNPLVNTYPTSDGRWVALCMLQPDRYFDGLVRALQREDMTSDPRFATPEARREQGPAIVEELTRTFSAMTLAEARAALERQPGQWDVLNHPGELLQDPQALANGFVQQVDYGDGRSMPLCTTPVQFDREAPELVPAPAFCADTDEVLAEIGMDEEAILQAKIDGSVV
jgi:crotonobetainyl-CoA:carnitine CoA-transferase CaiB-like acyl-CoA transferase